MRIKNGTNVFRHPYGLISQKIKFRLTKVPFFQYLPCLLKWFVLVQNKHFVFLKSLKWAVSPIKGILIQIHLWVVRFQVSCSRQNNEWITDLFPAANIHHFFIKFNLKFLIFFGQVLYQIHHHIHSPYKKKMLWIIIVIVYKT